MLRLVVDDCRGALILLALAAATDAADGYLARRYAWTSRLGAWLDPIADKLLLTAVFISLGVLRVVPSWLVWLVIGRDALILLMAAMGLLFTRHRDFPPSVWGKISTVVQIGTALAGVAWCSMQLPDALVWLTAAVTIISGVHYLWRGVRLLTAGS